MGMEDETKAFLVLIVQTISIVLLWMMVNVYVGIYHGFAFFDNSPGWKNILYYFAFLLTFFLLVRHLKNKWKSFK